MHATSLVLYYPHAYFLTDQWLKLAVLTHARIARIRPAGYPEDERPLARVVQAEMPGFITDIAPDTTDLDFAAARFQDIFLEAYSGNDRFEFRFSLENYHYWQYRPWVYNSPPPWVHHISGATYIWTPNEARMTAKLQEKLLSARLAGADNDDSPTWLFMHPALAEIYAALLSFSVAQRNGLVGTTDDPVAHRAYGDASFGRLFEVFGRLLDERPSVTPERQADELESYYMQLSVAASLRPADLDQLPVERLVEFRLEHEQELTRLQQHVSSLRPELEAVTRVEGVDGARLHLEQVYAEKTRPLLLELQAKLKGCGIDTTLGLLGLKFETQAATATALGLAATAAASAAALPPIAASSFLLLPLAAALTVLPYYRKRREEKRSITDASPASYLLALSKHSWN